MTSQLFTAPGEIGDIEDRLTMANAPFGERVDTIGRYKMPLLPGERGTKSGGDWVPGGIQSATNLAGAIVESRQLGIWERELSQVGLALRPELNEQLFALVHKARAQGVDFLALRDHKPVRAALDEIHRAAKDAAGGNQAARAGTNRHDVWEERAKSGLLVGTPQINKEVGALEELLERNDLERVPGLSERTIRNTSLRAAGRFDDVLRDRRTGLYHMADLKTKRRKFYTWLEVRIQLAVYATAEHMLVNYPGAAKMLSGAEWYIPGPVHHVDQELGVILHAPSDGSPPELRRVNLVKGYSHALLARAVCDARSEAKNVAAHGESLWREEGSR